MKTTKHLSQDFPRYATSLSRRVSVSEEILAETHANHLKFQSGMSALWLNGVLVQAKDVNPFSLLRLMKKEKGMISSLTRLGLSRGEALDLLTNPELAAAQSDKGMLDGLYDASDRPEGGDVIVYWNDIEKDSR